MPDDLKHEDILVPRKDIRFHDRVGDWILKQFRDDGISVMDADWDTLIILDACRYDTFARVHDLPGQLRRVKSKGTATNEFIAENFHGGEFLDTVYVSGNAQIASHVEDGDVEFFKVAGLWEDADLDGIGYLVHPETVVEETVDLMETYPNKRFIVHFLQPHAPFVVKDGEFIKDATYRYFDPVWQGEISGEVVASIYEENVEYVLEYVEDLLDEVEGKTVVTADHGELLGEDIPLRYKLLHSYWPIGQWDNYRFGHYSFLRIPPLTDVPWLEIETGSRRNIETADRPASPQLEMEREQIEDHLKALGYV